MHKLYESMCLLLFAYLGLQRRALTVQSANSCHFVTDIKLLIRSAYYAFDWSIWIDDAERICGQYQKTNIVDHCAFFCILKTTTSFSKPSVQSFRNAIKQAKQKTYREWVQECSWKLIAYLENNKGTYRIILCAKPPESAVPCLKCTAHSEPWNQWLHKTK